MHSIVSLISGRGSNFEAIYKAAQAKSWDVRFTGLIANQPEAKGLALAKSVGIPTAVIDHRAYPSREAFDRALMQQIDAFSADLVVLAGFMRILTPGLIEHYEGRMMNIHPSLLPRFPGLHTHERALEAGDRVHGATVHFVSAGVDEGPIICQSEVPVLPTDTPSELAARVLKTEHQIYPLAVEWFIQGRLQITGNRVRVDPPELQYIPFP
ncbi:MAG: phosphoribosylglycinamide formyltransferase [Burkholderiaceae bacterium]|jgi:phosphoribosylglycinamide formyltransferase-1|nr:phosphoribosylglycinamide formyltransferase [Burkholderiales bacterium]NDC65692.1 phosphoribosylglycinamide formyltransferase [Burkholderiaceae bacterium]NDH82360.1 phosphoribosylglycinamide formyltransferase [Burkholderiaceae bacterium]NDI20184.1 phosphoribosylglycinamide formyltransferase [Burkholderiaceae bacterium]